MDLTDKMYLMRATILQSLTELIENDVQETGHQSAHKLTELILKSRLDLSAEQEAHTKKLITATIENYLSSPNTALREALKEHYKILEDYLTD